GLVLDNEGGKFLRDRLPKGLAMLLEGIFQKTRIELSGVRQPGGWLSFKAKVIWMHIQQRHAAVLGDPIEFLEPNVGVALPEEQEQCRVLWQRVRQLDVAVSPHVRSYFAPVCCLSNPKRKNRAHSVGLGFEGVRVEGRRVVSNLEIPQPVEVVE